MEALALCHPALQSGGDDAGMLHTRAQAWADVGEWARSLADYTTLLARGLDFQHGMHTVQQRLAAKHPKQLHAVLGVAPECSNDEVRTAYRRLALKVHPDKAPTIAARRAFEELFNIVTDARNVMSNATARKRYEAQVKLTRTGRASSSWT